MSREAETVSSRQTPAEAGQLMPIQTNPAATRIIAMKDAATKDTVASAVSSAARSSAAVFQSPSPPKPYQSAIRRWVASPGNWRSPCKSSKVSVKPLNPPPSRKARSPNSSLEAYTSESRLFPPSSRSGATL